MKKHFRHMALSVMLAAGMCVPGNGMVFAAPDQTGRWVSENQGWRYYNAAGTACTGWIETASGWYYLDLQTGLMKTGLQQIDGKTYYFTATGENGIEGKLFCGWREEVDGTRRFFGTSHDGSFGSMQTGWQWIDGYCYYFGENGVMTKNATTPEGYQVNEQGQWVGEDGTVQFEAGKGLSSTEKKAGPGNGTSTGSSSSSGSGGSSSGGSGSAGSGSSSSGGNHSGTNNSGNSSSDSDNSGSDKENNGSDHENGGNHGSNSGENNSGQIPETTPLLKEAQTKLIDLGWTQYAVFAFTEGSIADYSIEVDGIDITDACTKVDDQGTIVKWQTTVWHPGTITVTRNTDGKNQRVLFSKESETVTEAGNPESAPKNLVTNGAISVFDYYLDNYDSDGNVRVRPGKTTFAVNGTQREEKAEVPTDYYVPDAEIDQDGKGEILVKLSLKTEEQESWFDGLTTIKAMDTENKIINTNLTFTKDYDETYGKTGVIKIALPATNMRSRGQYQLNLVSSYSKNKLTVPVELVDATEYKMMLGSLNPNPQPGECLNFDIVGANGETFGNEILSPIYRVDLTMPSGKVKTLTKISQWYEIGSMLHICGVDTDDETNIITDERGVYTVTVYAHGYQTMSKKVEIGNASAANNIASFAAKTVSVEKNDDYGIDALSGATSMVPDSGSDSDGSGSNVLNGWLVFDHDLLANALILNEIHPTEESSAVAKWYFDQSRVYVTDETAEDFYDFTRYLNAVKDAKLNGIYLTFEQYQAEETQENNGRPYQIKRVLEDGKLGSTENLTTMIGKNAPELSGLSGKIKENLVLSTKDDSEYFQKIQGIYLDGSATALRHDDYLSQYEFNEDRSELTIYAYPMLEGTVGETLQLTPGTHTLRIVAEGYKETTVTLEIAKDIEVFDLSLAENPERTEDEEATAYHVGQSVYVQASSKEGEMQGDFLKNLEEVTLNGKQVLPYGAGQIGGECDYRLEDGRLILGKNLFEKAGRYTLQLKANADAGYAPKTLTFNLLEEATVPGEEKNAAPEFKKAVLKEENGFFAKAPYYQLFFDGMDLDGDGETEDDVETWLRADNLTVYVDGVVYEAGMYSDNTGRYAIEESENWRKSILAIRPESMSGEHEVKITAEGYEDCEFTFTGEAEEKEEKEAPVLKKTEMVENDTYGDYYKIQFTGETVSDFFEEDSLLVKVNGENYEKPESTFWASYVSTTRGTNLYSFNPYSNELEIRPENMMEDLEVEITAEGYEPLIFTITAASDEKKTPDVKESYYVEESETLAYYRVDFAAENDEELSKYLNNRNMVLTVNGEEYERGYSMNADSTKTFVAVGKMGAYGTVYSYLKLSTDAFTEAENEVVIEVEGYEPLNFIIENSDMIDGDEDEAFTPEVTKTKYVEKSWFDPAYYQIKFKEDEDKKIKEYLESEELSVAVNGEDYVKTNSFAFGNSANNFYAGTIAGTYGSEYVIKLTTDMFTEDSNLVEIEAGDEFGKIALTIKKDGSLVTVDTAQADDDLDAVAEIELPVDSDEITDASEKNEEILDEIIDEDENIADEKAEKDNAEDKSDTEDTSEIEDKSDERKEEDSAMDEEEEAPSADSKQEESDEELAPEESEEDESSDTDEDETSESDMEEDVSESNETESDTEEQK